MVAIEIADRRVDVEALPGFRHQHRQALACVAAAPDEQFEGIVEHRRVGASLIDDRRQQRFVGPLLGTETTLAGTHPVDVALDGVDLAVVAEHPERLSPLPRGGGVRAVALMKDGEGGDKSLIAKVGVERGQLVGGTHGLVGHGAKRHRRDVGAQPGGPNGALDTLPRPVTAGLRI